MQVARQPEQEAKLLKTEVRGREMAPSASGVGRLDQTFENIQRDGLNSVAEQELVAAGKPFDGRDEPRQELVVCFNRRAGGAGAVVSCSMLVILIPAHTAMPFAPPRRRKKNRPRGLRPLGTPVR